jgi:hypothetical protein
MAKVYNKVQILLRETWRKAYKVSMEGREGLVIQFETESQAHKARMDLYKAVKEEKAMQSEDLELQEAAQTIEIVLGENRSSLVMRSRGQNPIYAALEKAIGMSIETAVDPEMERQAEESLRSLQKSGVIAKPEDGGGLATKHLPNPYYTRKG